MAAQWSRLTGLLAGNEDAQLVDSHPDLSVHDFNLLVLVEAVIDRFADPVPEAPRRQKRDCRATHPPGSLATLGMTGESLALVVLELELRLRGRETRHRYAIRRA